MQKYKNINELFEGRSGTAHEPQERSRERSRGAVSMCVAALPAELAASGHERRNRGGPADDRGRGARLGHAPALRALRSTRGSRKLQWRINGQSTSCESAASDWRQAPDDLHSPGAVAIFPQLLSAHAARSAATRRCHRVELRRARPRRPRRRSAPRPGFRTSLPARRSAFRSERRSSLLLRAWPDL